MVFSTYNGVPLPHIMYGTAWKKEQTAKLVELALNTGFTAIDTANQLKHYDEALVGEAVAAAFSRGVPRASLFLQTKWTSIDGQDDRLPYDAKAPLAKQVVQSMDSSLQHLHTDYVDSYVLHGPHYRNVLGAEDWEVWQAIEGLFEAGKTRVIGVSNVNSAQLSELCAKAKVKPMVVQNRCYAMMGWDRDVRDICKREGIIYQGFSLLTANAREANTAEIKAIAKRVGATIPQVIFRFAIYAGMLPLTGTNNEQHMREDLDCMRFDLAPEEISTISSISG